MLAPFDFAAAWTAYLQQQAPARLDPTEDHAFWQTYAPYYDERTGLPGSYDQTLALLRGLVLPTDTLLDVGAGTGRFALPLARQVRRITALDQSAAMLAILAQKAATQQIDTIALVEADWETATVAPHDVVLAAWSLYRQINLRAALERLVAATRRTLVIVGSAGGAPPHRALVESCCGRWTEADIPVHLAVAGTLWQIGRLAEVRVLYETRLIEHESPLAIARLLAPLNAPAAATEQLAKALLPRLTRHAGGWRYRFIQAVGVVIWQAAAAALRRTSAVTAPRCVARQPQQCGLRRSAARRCSRQRPRRR